MDSLPLKQEKDFIMKYIIIVLLTLATAHTSMAQSKRRAKKVNTKKLIDNYWSPSKGEYRVIQKRYFAKQNRLNISLLGGLHINDPYSDGFAATFAAGYFFNEHLGIELDYTQSFLEDGEAQEALNNESTGAATFEYGRTTNTFGAKLLYSPIYAKMSLLGTNLIYFDLMFSLRVGLVSYEQITQAEDSEQSTISAGFGVHQLFYLNKSFALRIDLENNWYNSDIRSFQDGDDEGSRLINDTVLKAGINILF